ncbi:MAG: hypothetical protein U9R15_17430 [Chloroflexota bacterium]|nr:hypothetical protein [Chloroflexota bacterium]
MRTTQLYTHVSNRDIGQIRSPLDNSMLKDEEASSQLVKFRVIGVRG